ncbi:MAG: SOS response-associated peptidase [Gaiellales bacterium]
MCGRFTNTRERAELVERFAAKVSARLAESYGPRYNVAPTQTVAAIRIVGDDGERIADALRWGLIPRWAKDRKLGYKLINAKAETLAEKPAFRSLLPRHRCLIPADGFYEWRTNAEGKRVPVRYTIAADELFAFAGLWAAWHDPELDELVESCTIVTTRANDLVAAVHDRMPVILPREVEADWLDPDISVEHAVSLLEPFPAGLMRARPASPLVNSVKNEGPELLVAA